MSYKKIDFPKGMTTEYTYNNTLYVKACPKCGNILAYTCHHSSYGDIYPEWMGADEALKLLYNQCEYYEKIKRKYNERFWDLKAKL